MRPLIEVMSEAMHDLGDWNPQESAEYVEGRLRAAGHRILGPDEVDALQKALYRAEDGAGTLPARDAVKLRPADWHAIGDLIRTLGRKS